MNIEKQQRNSRYRLELKKKATKEELIVKEYLESKKIKFIFQKGFLSPFHRIVDFYIKKGRIILEIDGGYHNNIKQKDYYKDLIWTKLKFHTIRIDNEDVINGSYKKIIDLFL